jgi:hypothetical protein
MVASQSGVTTPPLVASEFIAFDVTVVGQAGLAEVFALIAPISRAAETLTVSVEMSLFDDRFGLRYRRPRGLAPMPSFPVTFWTRCGAMAIGTAETRSDPVDTLRFTGFPAKAKDIEIWLPHNEQVEWNPGHGLMG